MNMFKNTSKPLATKFSKLFIALGWKKPEPVVKLLPNHFPPQHYNCKSVMNLDSSTSPKPKKVLIIALTLNMAKEYARTLRLNSFEWSYVDKSYNLVGMDNHTIYITETAHMLPTYDAIMYYLKAGRGHKVIYIDADSYQRNQRQRIEESFRKKVAPVIKQVMDQEAINRGALGFFNHSPKFLSGSLDVPSSLKSPLQISGILDAKSFLKGDLSQYITKGPVVEIPKTLDESNKQDIIKHAWEDARKPYKITKLGINDSVTGKKTLIGISEGTRVGKHYNMGP